MQAITMTESSRMLMRNMPNVAVTEYLWKCDCPYYTCRGNRPFWHGKVEIPLLMNSQRRCGRSLFWHRKVDRALRLFHGRRAIALFGIKRLIALYYFFSGKGDRSFWYRKVDRSFGMERLIALFFIERSIAFLGDESKDATEPSNKFNPPAHLFHF